MTDNIWKDKNEIPRNLSPIVSNTINGIRCGNFQDGSLKTGMGVLYPMEEIKCWQYATELIDKLSQLQAENERYKKALKKAKSLFLREVEIDAIHSVTDENAPEETFKRVADSFRRMALLEWDNDMNRIINHKDNDDEKK